MNENAIFVTHDLAVGYRNGKNVVTLLEGLNLTLEKGKLVALLGQNGAGKSTLLRALTCDERPLSGSIQVNGKNLLEMSQKERSRLIGLVSTERIQAGALTVTELVGLGRQPHTGFLTPCPRSSANSSRGNGRCIPARCCRRLWSTSLPFTQRQEMNL